MMNDAIEPIPNQAKPQESLAMKNHAYLL